MALTVLLPENPYSRELLALLGPLLPPDSQIRDPDTGLEGLAGQRLLFALALDEGGCSESGYRMLMALRRSRTLLEGCVAGLVVTGRGELYTKDAARDLVFAANQAGCDLSGTPAGGGHRLPAELPGAGPDRRHRRGDGLPGRRIGAAGAADGVGGACPLGRVLALHASQRSTSNTLALWEMVRRSLPPEVQVQEICLRNGTMADCNGCSYTACMHFGERGGCFYGGPMVEEVYPAVRSCDTLVMVCANYNDALSANLTACVNRLTALFRQTRFYEKRLYGLVVSGYSGGDLLARQLISALNMNKAFYLPPRFCLLETANERGSLVRLPGIREKARCFARQMME